jgi:hypothetical protein
MTMNISISVFRIVTPCTDTIASGKLNLFHEMILTGTPQGCKHAFIQRETLLIPSLLSVVVTVNIAVHISNK